MKTSTTRSLKVETLENRELMACNVSVSFSNGDLYITGDASRNHVEVRQSSAGVYKITGQTIGGSATKVNGYANGTTTISNFSGNVWVSLGGGDDQLNFGTGDNRLISLPKGLSIDMGSGGDFLSIRDVKTTGNMSINTGTGVKDETHIYKADVGGHLGINDPGSVNNGDYDIATVNSCKVKGQLQFVFKGGNDRVEIISTGANTLYADLGAGNDYFRMNYTKPRLFTAIGGSGTDIFAVPDYNGTRFNGSGFETFRR